MSKIFLGIGLAFLLLWISVLSFGNYLIPSWQDSIVRLSTFSMASIALGYRRFWTEGYTSYIFISWALGWLGLVGFYALYYGSDVATSLLCLFLSASAFIVWLILVVLTHLGRLGRSVYKRVKEIIKIVVNGIINLFTIKSEVSRKCPAALEAKILEKEKNAVKVGVFGPEPIDVIIESSEGVAEDIHKGETITL